MTASMLPLQGKKVLVMEDTACKAGERTIIKNFWYEFLPGERIGIVGPNGAGKSSLLDMITGDRQLQAGQRDVGETTALGYFRQHVPDVKPTLKIIDYIRYHLGMLICGKQSCAEPALCSCYELGVVCKSATVV